MIIIIENDDGDADKDNHDYENKDDQKSLTIL